MSLKKTIVRILKEQEDDSIREEHQEILEYNRQLEFLKKHADIIMEYVEDVVKGYNVKNLDYRIGRVWKGSWDWNKPFEDFTIELSFIDLNRAQRSEVKKEVKKMFRNLFNMDVEKYICPLDLKFINHAPQEF